MQEPGHEQERTDGPPRVTAVMVTGHDPRRRPLALLTARAFPRQTYPSAELLIVNQGAEPLLAEPISRVREVMDRAGLVVGALRNLAWRHATGELMTCWDDDDVHHPERIARQVAHFDGRPVAFKYELLLHLRTGEAGVVIRYNGFENSLLWPRACASRYAEKPRRGDADFRRRLIEEYGGIAKMENPPSLYVRLFHGRNIWNEPHFIGMPRQRGANAEERRLVDRLLPVYREAAA